MPAASFRHLGGEAEEEALLLLPVGHSLITAIGIDSYAHHPQLTNAVSDAKAVLELFKRCGIEELPGNLRIAYSYLGQAIRTQVERNTLKRAEDVLRTYLLQGAPLGHENEVRGFLGSRMGQQIQEARK